MDPTEKIRQFHAHLNTCEQCRNHPFDLCATGARLLHDAATCAEQNKEGTIAHLTNKADLYSKLDEHSKP